MLAAVNLCWALLNASGSGLLGVRRWMRVVTGSTAVIGPRDSARAADASIVLAALSALIRSASSWAGGRGSAPSWAVSPERTAFSCPRQ